MIEKPLVHVELSELGPSKECLDRIRRIEMLMRWFAGERWKIYAGVYKNFYPKSCQDDPPADHVIAERKDYDVTTVDLTELCGFLEAREF